MLIGLDTIPWGSLSHAYGTAEDVPDMLRRLAMGAEEALDEAWGNIYHQGTVYSASTTAVPFLIEMLNSQSADRAGILQLLQAMATGSGETAEAVRSSIANGSETYVRLLTDTALSIRSLATHVLGTSIDTSLLPEVNVALLHQLASESEQCVRASLVFAIYALGTPTSDWLEQRLTSEATCERIAAALLLAKASPELSPEIFTILAEEAPLAYNQLSEICWIRVDGDPVSVIVNSLQRWQDQVTLLEQWMQSDAPKIRRLAISSAGMVSQHWQPAAPRVVSLLARALSDPEEANRYSAAYTLSNTGQAAALACDTLLDVLRNEPLGWHTPASYALLTLCQHKDTRVLPILAKLLSEVALPLPAELKAPIECLGPWALPCLQPLLNILGASTDSSSTISIILAIGRFGKKLSPKALDLLIEQVDDYPQALCMALASLGSHASGHVHVVHSLFEQDDMRLQLLAAQAVWACTANPKLVLPVLAKTLQAGSSDVWARDQALALIQQIMPANREFS